MLKNICRAISNTVKECSTIAKEEFNKEWNDYTNSESYKNNKAQLINNLGKAKANIDGFKGAWGEFKDEVNKSAEEYGRKQTIIKKEQEESFIRGWLGRMLFSGEEALKEVNVLSGGEKVRCMFAKMMLENGNVVLMDEPTNHLDLESITALNKGMQNFRGNILFATHDQEIIETVADRIIDIVDEGKVIDFTGTYQEYVEKYHNI